MAHSASAKKRIRQNESHNARNRWRKERVKKAVRLFEDALSAHDTEKAAECLKVVFKQLDQVAATGTIHKRTADRRKSRLTLKLNKALA
ncbi:MAG: 30S ribosomal protein S20 [Phycisphaerae bacterium]|nr:30S ribosomal protein S20 [Phycisphaerae bacterium]MDP7290162.1 30S ribosomal protein S20 [Phycisphaerae bacterium]